MTSQEKTQLNRLEKQLEELPDVIMARLDDRYLKKDDAPDQYFTRLEGKAATWVVSIAVTLLALWNAVETFAKKP